MEVRTVMVKTKIQDFFLTHSGSFAAMFFVTSDGLDEALLAKNSIYDDLRSGCQEAK